MEKKTRKSKYEVLRIIAMFMIVLSHYAYHGGVMFEGNVLNQIVGSVLVLLCMNRTNAVHNTQNTN